MANFLFTLFNQSMNVSFGAKLLTTPEQFFTKTDTPDDKQKIRRFVNGIKLLVENPVIDSVSNGDTITLKRATSKNGKNFYITYNSPDLQNVRGLKNAHMIADDFSIKDLLFAFEQLTLPMMYKKCCFCKNRSLFTSYDKNFIDTFGVSFLDFIKSLEK